MNVIYIYSENVSSRGDQRLLTRGEESAFTSRFPNCGRTGAEEGSGLLKTFSFFDKAVCSSQYEEKTY
jgi:hypothetical protein